MILKAKEFIKLKEGAQFIPIIEKDINLNDENATVHDEDTFIVSAKRIKDGHVFVSQEPFHVRKRIFGGLELIQEISVDIFYLDLIHVDISAYLNTEDYSYCAGVGDDFVEINEIENIIPSLLEDLDRHFKVMYPKLKY